RGCSLKLIAPDILLDKVSLPDRAKAEEIVKELGGLPLALDEAGAFIEETQLSLNEYLELYKKEGIKLFVKRDENVRDTPTVRLVFSLNFKQINDNNRATADLIRVCILLAPSAIPEEIFIEGAIDLGEYLQSLAGSSLAFINVLREANRYSLVVRNPT